MKISFYIRYTTQPGESLHVTGDIEALGLNDDQQLFDLHYFDHEYWTGTIEVDPVVAARVQYSYVFRSMQGDLLHEGGRPRAIDTGKSGLGELQLIDAWNPSGAYENVFYTDAFQHVLLTENTAKSKSRSSKHFTHLFRVHAPLLRKHEALVLLGNSMQTGEWNTDQAVMMSSEHGWWTARLKLPNETLPLQYKYGIFNTRDKSFVRYEEGDNRIVHGDGHAKKLTIVHDAFVRLPNDTWKGAGVSIPLFSLRSKDSFGVGEFTDLKLLVDWAEKTGLRLIQLLPVNDTTVTNSWRDSYPYASISTFALHPIYLNLEAIGGRHDPYIKSLRKKQRQLNELPEVDYEQVMKFKMSTARELFAARKGEFLRDEDFLGFFSQNRHWLVPYAAFCYLRDRNGTADFTRWKIYSQYDKSSIEKYVSPRARHYDEIAFTYFIQYHLHLQLREAVEYAHRSGIILKGDIPIGVNRNGCDAWIRPELFNMKMQSGAPPDPFAIKGQNWGFPTYNWNEMAREHFGWWRSRFAQMSLYFDAFRIDHILGFFRMWSIPEHAVEGIMGVFDPALPVHVYEFGQRGMWFNYFRFCKPFITDAVLWELFGPNKDKFLPFLRSHGNHQYSLVDEFATQRQVERYFENLPDDTEHRNIRNGLYDLISNVILFEVPGSNGQEFHFRISMEATTSFRHLDWTMQQQLKALYTDYFYRRQEEFWQNEAMKKLPSLKRSTNMLVFGEDLGMVPASVPEVMKLLGILSLEVQRMPKVPGTEFSDPASAPYLSVVTPSTHDMSTIRSWWEENREVTQRFFNGPLGQWGEAPQTCEPWISRAIVLQHLQSPAMWSVFQLQDLLGMDESLRRPDHQAERVNVPAVSEYYWRYRMHIPLEQLLREKEFNHSLQNYIQVTGR